MAAAGSAVALVGHLLWTAPAVAEEIRVDELEFDVDGMTSERALRAFIDLEVGETFASMTDLVWVLNRERQDLLNRRYFATVEYEVDTSTTAAGYTSARIRYQIDEQLALLPLPYVLYDSNRGAEVGFELRYNNAFGTLTDWRLGPSFDIRPDGELGEWAIPVELRRLKIGPRIYSFSIRQRHDQVIIEDEDGTREVDFDVDRTELSASTIFQWPRLLFFYSIASTVRVSYNYRGLLQDRRDRFSVGFRHAFGRSNTNWRDNLRFGYGYGLTHSLAFVQRIEEDVVVNDLLPSGTLYVIFWDRFNYYARLRGSVALNGLERPLGSQMRGIADFSFSGNWSVVANQTLGIEVLSFGDALDVQVHPFFDVGVAHTIEESLDEFELRTAAGVDFLLFLDFISGFILRFTVGFDLGRKKFDEPEIIFAIDPFY